MTNRLYFGDSPEVMGEDFDDESIDLIYLGPPFNSRRLYQAFNGARQQAGADIGILTCFEDRVTKGMRDAAASTGRFMNVPTVRI